MRKPVWARDLQCGAVSPFSTRVRYVFVGPLCLRLWRAAAHVVSVSLRMCFVRGVCVSLPLSLLLSVSLCM